ncbi:MAG: Nif3-like dinuclear metal center hexameric protein [Butyrivibrio sp.]
MKAKDIADILEKFCPPKFACDWDNTGMIVGHRDNEIKRILITVDADDKAVEYALNNNCDMIIAHHPLIFSGVRQINDDSFTGRRVMKLIENHINCYCMHTNFDTAGGMAEKAADLINLKNCVVLEEVKDGEGIGRVGELTAPMTVRKLCELVKERFGLKAVSLYGDENMTVSKAAICPGSGKDEIPAALSLGAQVLITGDISYHYGIDSVSEGLQIIDAGHYGIEHIFIEIMEDYLNKNLRDVVICSMDIDNPQKII